MKKIVFLLFFSFSSLVSAQAHRFFYELTYKSKKDSPNTEKITTILDITKEKSIYRDFLSVSQDSILKVSIEKMQKSGTFQDFSKLIKKSKFAYKVIKNYPGMDVKFSENILQDKVSYHEKIDFSWKITPEKESIGEYNAQKATTTFGGRNWIAWFTTEIPFQDGPYKFSGLPGLIVKIEDSEQNYSWVIQGNTKIDPYDEESFSEKLMKQYGGMFKDLEVSKEKFNSMYETYKKDPFGGLRQQFSKIPTDAKAPDGRLISEVLKEQEKQLKDFLNSNNNGIEIAQPIQKKKKNK